MPKRDERTHILHGGRIYGEGFAPMSELAVKPQEAATTSSPDRPGAGTPSGLADTDLVPEDFPGREDLAKAGITTLSSVRGASDDELLALDGIGEATVKKIRAAQG